MLRNSVILLTALCFIGMIACNPKRVTDSRQQKHVSVVDTSWAGSWERSEWQNNARLEIRYAGTDSIAFTFFAASGGHSGELEGRAGISGKRALFYMADMYDTCMLVFEMTGDTTIVVDQQKGNCGAPMGVIYSGMYYKPGAGPEQETSLSDIGMLDRPADDSLLRLLTRDKYDLFVQSTQLTSEEEDLDSLGAQVTTSGVQGLFTIMEHIIMTDTLGHIWAAVIDDQKVLYFTNREDDQNKLPRTIEHWRSRFPEYKVQFMNGTSDGNGPE